MDYDSETHRLSGQVTTFSSAGSNLPPIDLVLTDTQNISLHTVLTLTTQPSFFKSIESSGSRNSSNTLSISARNFSSVSFDLKSYLSSTDAIKLIQQGLVSLNVSYSPGEAAKWFKFDISSLVLTGTPPSSLRGNDTISNRSKLIPSLGSSKKHPRHYTDIASTTPTRQAFQAAPSTGASQAATAFRSDATLDSIKISFLAYSSVSRTTSRFYLLLDLKSNSTCESFEDCLPTSNTQDPDNEVARRRRLALGLTLLFVCLLLIIFVWAVCYRKRSAWTQIVYY